MANDEPMKDQTHAPIATAEANNKELLGQLTRIANASERIATRTLVITWMVFLSIGIPAAIWMAVGLSLALRR